MKLIRCISTEHTYRRQPFYRENPQVGHTWSCDNWPLEQFIWSKFNGLITWARDNRTWIPYLLWTCIVSMFHLWRLQSSLLPAAVLYTPYCTVPWQRLRISGVILLPAHVFTARFNAQSSIFAATVAKQHVQTKRIAVMLQVTADDSLFISSPYTTNNYFNVYSLFTLSPAGCHRSIEAMCVL